MAKITTNMRSTRRTELDDVFPTHVVNEWLGHSSEIAERHYQQVTPDHWDRSTKQVSAQVSIGGNQEASRRCQATGENQENPGNSRFSLDLLAHSKVEKYPRQDLNL